MTGFWSKELKQVQQNWHEAGAKQAAKAGTKHQAKLTRANAHGLLCRRCHTPVDIEGNGTQSFFAAGVFILLGTVGMIFPPVGIVLLAVGVLLLVLAPLSAAGSRNWRKCHGCDLHWDPKDDHKRAVRPPSPVRPPSASYQQLPPPPQVGR